MKNINNVESKSGLIYTVLRIQSITNVMEIDIPSKKDAIEVSRIINEMIQKAIRPATSQSTFIDPIEKIKKLAELKEMGILTEEEFIKKKEELLGKV